MPDDLFLLPQTLEASAARTPDSDAVSCGDERLSFAELADRVARLAGALRAGGVGPNDRCAVFMAKSVDAFVSMHAAQRAGAIAVPINPASPASVVEAVFADVTPAAAIIDRRTVRNLPVTHLPPLLIGVETTELAAHAMGWDEVAASEPSGIAPRLGADPAYMITTSGSTGLPKAIVHSHTSGLRYAQLAVATYAINDSDRLGNVAPFHFDQSTFELYASTLAGACAVLIPDALLKFPANLSQLIETEHLTTWYSVPTILQQLAERGALADRDLSCLRWVKFGGEVFPPAVLRALAEHMPNARFSNVYGPAEVNQCTYHHVAGLPADGDDIPIGSSWDDTQVELLHPTTDTVLDGPTVGHLVVRSSTMMLGYWKRQDLTEDAVMYRNGTDGLPQRWYRTGDLVERLADDQLVFRGRIDRQVKVRGNRIELEAVESAVAGLAGITGCAALVRGQGADARLVVIAETLVPAADIVTHARAVLPPYAVPDLVQTVPSLPRTGSGKIDARAASQLLVEQEISP